MTHQTIVVSNRKGGVGKTTVAAHLAAGLAIRGYNVLLADTDPQGHCATATGIEKGDHLAEVTLNRTAKITDHIFIPQHERIAPPHLPMQGNLFILPGDKGTAMIPIHQKSAFTFKNVIDRAARLLELDFVIVDTSPTNSMFDGSVLFAADHMLLITECAALSFDGLTEALADINDHNIDAADFRNTPINILGIVPNKLRISTNNHKDNIKRLVDQFGMQTVWSPITERTVWESAFEYGQLVYSFAPNGAEYRDAWTLVQTALRRLNLIAPTFDLVAETLEKANAS